MNIVKLNQFITKLDSVSSNSTDENRKKAMSAVKTRLLDLRKTMENQAKENNELIIAIVGQMKAGKSSLLNALLFEGVDVLPTASTPMTAGLTVIQYVENPEDQRFEVEYYTKDEWGNIKGEYTVTKDSLNELRVKFPELNKNALISEFKELCEKEGIDYQKSLACYELYAKMLEHPECGQKTGQPNDSVRFTNLSEVYGVLINYVGSAGIYAPVVKAVHIYVNSPLLTYKNDKTGLTESYKIVDTPGINDPVESRDRIAKDFLKNAHAAIMMTRAERSKTQTDISFINRHIIKGGMSKILFTFNKLDLLFDAEANDGKLPDDFLAAMADYEGFEDGSYENWGYFYNTFNGDIKPLLTNADGVLWHATCPYAENIRLKLNKAGGNIQAAQLLEQEATTLRDLQNWFPDDFSEENPELTDNLSLLGGIQRLKEDFLLKEFLSNKDRIVAKRYEDQNHVLRDEVLNQFDAEVKGINENQALLESVDLEDIKKQIGIVYELRNVGMKDLYDCVEKVIKRLMVFVKKTLFAEKLLSYKISLNSDATDYERISYTRKGTKDFMGFGGYVKHEDVLVNRVQPDAVVSSHNKQIGKLNEQLKRLWKENFLRERDELVKSLLQCIETIANKDNTIAINASVYTKAIDNVIDKVLIGREILDTSSWVGKQKIGLDDYARKNEHVILSTNYSDTRMTTDEACRKIELQANDKVSSFKSGMNKRYIEFYDGLREQVLNEIHDLNGELIPFVEGITGELLVILEKFINEKEKLINDRENTEKEKKQLVTDLNNLKTQFEKL